MYPSVEAILEANITLFREAGVPYLIWEHEPILDFDTDEKVAARLGWTGALTKSLFLKLKGSGYALLFTHKDQRLDTKSIKALTGKRPSIAGDEEMTAVTGCLPKAVSPFTLPPDIPLIIDPDVYKFKELMFTPGPPVNTMGFASRHLDNILAAIPNPVLVLGNSQ
ncbi:YbaK/EbsC family protein [Parasalinivibrio latis]|uniref:YbaK/EbsC family protein n=1 Tax=Parasalinivibrio latis TaxID=2952610 RepID=UPI0030E46ECA